ncbi:hypothetical protein KFL_000710070 [Klebsormidium nitens]|uniref:Protein TIC 20 n=1 Tax=Klebsormidium nitens TaxID=105231 RepID=A0A1Y1HTD0_KLENI|nr:hypothetical protein KFL_000710070 [Klebsormidium nitens]|eukprot:GAQ81102.1 hypothetical protein KFL_000710070 [Klebsormidium nitens]
MAASVCASGAALRAGLPSVSSRQQPVAKQSFTPLLRPLSTTRQHRLPALHKAPLSSSLFSGSQLNGAHASSFMAGPNPFAAELKRTQAKRLRAPRAVGARASLIARWKTQWIREGNKPFPTMMEKPFFFWRILAILPYLPSIFEGTLSIAYSGKFGAEAMDAVTPIATVLEWYSKIPIIPMAVFFLLFFTIIQNTKMPHFVRWHTLQSVLCEIVLTIRVFVQQILPPTYIIATFTETMFYLGFFVWFCSMYSALHAAFGLYADIPFLSDAVYIQVPMGTQKAQEKDEEPED